MSTRIELHLNSAEVEHLSRATPDAASQQDYLRALLKLANENESARDRARGWAEEERKIFPQSQDTPGSRKDYTEEDYRSAIEEAGSLMGASRILEVDRSTVREMAVIHDIPVDSLGGVPD